MVAPEVGIFTMMAGAVERFPLTASLLNLHSRRAMLPCLPPLVASAVCSGYTPGLFPVDGLKVVLKK